MIGLTYSVSEVHTHAYYAERAAALADCAELDRLYLKDPGGLLTPDAVRELAPHFIAAARRADDRAAQPLHDRARAVRVHGGAPGRLPGAAHGRRPAGARHVEPGRRDDASRPGGRRATRTGSTWTLWRRSRSTSRALAEERGLPVGRPQEFDATLLPPSAGRRHGLDDTADARGAAPARAASRPCWRRSPASAQRWVTRSSSRRSRSSWRRRRSGTSSTASAGQPSPTRRFATSSATTASPPRPWLRDVADRVLVAPTRRESFATSSRSASRRSASPFRPEDLRRGAAAAADDARGAGGRDARLAVDCGGARRTAWAGRHPVVTPAARGREASRRSAPPRAGGRRGRGVAPCDLTTSRASCSTSTARFVHRAGADGPSSSPAPSDVLSRIRASGQAARPLHERESFMPPRGVRGRDSSRAGLDVSGRRAAHAAQSAR